MVYWETTGETSLAVVSSTTTNIIVENNRSYSTIPPDYKVKPGKKLRTPVVGPSIHPLSRGKSHAAQYPAAEGLPLVRKGQTA